MTKRGVGKFCDDGVMTIQKLITKNDVVKYRKLITINESSDSESFAKNNLTIIGESSYSYLAYPQQESWRDTLSHPLEQLIASVTSSFVW